ncbi:hypothetical protein ILYODFUR_031421 [Ilyodon furcidens]|uniref:Uncharacterized protein n=1 Tax=Ilyodon furcidens TaxID=33524 RepID=A0ABV0UBB7_9TELE
MSCCCLSFSKDPVPASPAQHERIPHPEHACWPYDEVYCYISDVYFLKSQLGFQNLLKWSQRLSVKKSGDVLLTVNISHLPV